MKHPESYHRYRKSKKGISVILYNGQKSSSIKRGHPAPDYTLEEFRYWLFNQDKFHKLYQEWVDSGYHKDIKPSTDRLDDSLPYSLSNLQVITWKENSLK